MALAASAAEFPAAVEGDFTIRDFKFHDGETVAELKLHYYTIGDLKSQNVVLVMHGTGGTGKGFQSQGFGGELSAQVSRWTLRSISS